MKLVELAGEASMNYLLSGAELESVGRSAREVEVLAAPVERAELLVEGEEERLAGAVVMLTHVDRGRAESTEYLQKEVRLSMTSYERGRRPSEFSLNMIIFSSWATDRPTDRPTDRDSFQRLISFEPSYRLTNGFRHLKATFNKSFVLA